MKEIKLSQGKVTLVDDEIYFYLMQWKWHAYKNKRTYYAARKVRKEIRTTMHMHRVVMEFFQGKKDGMLVDHKDGDGLNNQYSNLRYVTYIENCENRYHERKVQQ